MNRPNRPLSVSSQPPHSRPPSIDPPDFRQRSATCPKEHRGASRRTRTADRNAQPCRALHSLAVEDFRIRIDDRFRVHRFTASGIEFIGNPWKRAEHKEHRRVVAINCTVENDNHPGFGAGTQAERWSGRRAWPLPGTERVCRNRATITDRKTGQCSGHRRQSGGKSKALEEHPT